MTTTSTPPMEAADTHLNAVQLVGRLADATVLRPLPSGDMLLTFRVVVDREPVRSETRRRVDALDCVAWSARVQRSVAGWSPGDLVQLEGQLRRRFRRADTGPVSKVEVEVVRARRLRRA